NVAADGGVTGFGLLVERRKSELQSEVGVNDAVGDVVSDAASLLLGGVGREIVDQPDVLHHGRDVVHQLQHEIHVGVVEPRWTINDVHATHRLVPVINRD